jgi:hypothetical protein
VKGGIDRFENPCDALSFGEKGIAQFARDGNANLCEMTISQGNRFQFLD